jgi:NAD(P)H-hydrate repair Nnr-like enzyme with NAD(P)H-hydrate epimerase domain
VTSEQIRNALETFGRVVLPAMERGNQVKMVEVPSGLSSETYDHIDRAISAVVTMAVEAERGEENDGAVH